MILPLVDNQTAEIFQSNIVPLDTTVHYNDSHVTMTTGVNAPAWLLISTQHILWALPRIVVVTIATI